MRTVPRHRDVAGKVHAQPERAPAARLRALQVRSGLPAGTAMAALCSAGAYFGLVVLATVTGQDAAEYPPAAGRLPVPVSATIMARFGPQLPCCGDGGGLRITAVPYSSPYPPAGSECPAVT